MDISTEMTNTSKAHFDIYNNFRNISRKLSKYLINYYIVVHITENILNWPRFTQKTTLITLTIGRAITDYHSATLHQNVKVVQQSGCKYGLSTVSSGILNAPKSALCACVAENDTLSLQRCQIYV